MRRTKGYIAHELWTLYSRQSYLLLIANDYIVMLRLPEYYTLK
jgi:hypothetical protein